MDTQQEELFRKVVQMMPEFEGRTDLRIKLSNSKKNYVIYDGNEQILIPVKGNGKRSAFRMKRQEDNSIVTLMNNELKSAVCDFSSGISVCFTSKKGGEIRMSSGAFMKFEYLLAKELPAARTVLEQILQLEIFIQLQIAERLGLTGEVVGQTLFRTRHAQVIMGHGELQYQFKKYFNPVSINFIQLFSGKNRVDIEKEINMIHGMEDFRRLLLEWSANWHLKLSTKKKQIPGIFSADEHFPDRVIFADLIFCGSTAGEDMKNGPIYQYDIREDILYYRDIYGEVTARSKNNTDVQFSESYTRFLRMRKHKNFTEAVEMIKVLKRDGIDCTTGKGLLNPGVTRVSYKDIFLEIRVKSWRTSYKEWKEVVSGILQLCQEKQQEYEAGAVWRIYELHQKFFDDPLGLAIADCVVKNEQYITGNAIVSIMRGTCVQLNMETIVPCMYEGSFNSLKEEEIKEYIRQMIKDGFFREIELKGTYGRFTILKLGTVGAFFKEHSLEIMKLVQDTWKSCQEYKLMKKYRDGETLNEQEYIVLLNLCEHYKKHIRIFSVHAEEYFGMFEKAPETVIQLLSMKKILEKDKFTLKLYREIEKAYKKGKQIS